MKKAFTLIELLAVIIILAIVALIATPLILNVINDSRRSANLSEAYLILNGAENYYASSLLDDSLSTKINGEDNVYPDINYSGEKPPVGHIIIKPNGDIAMAVYNDSICYTKSFIETTINEVEGLTDTTCKLDIDGNPPTGGDTGVNPPEETPAADIILNNNGGKAEIESKPEPDFTKNATTNEGMFSTTDSYGTSYYFRGAVDNNWVYFNDMYWRIVRIAGDGSVKLIYTGRTKPASSQSVVIKGLSTQAGTVAFNSLYDDNAYVGYMYTVGERQGLSESSTLKTYLENWYTLNMNGVDSQIKDNVFCYDRSLATGGWQESAYGFTNGIYAGTGVGNASSLYAAAERITASVSGFDPGGTGPSLECSSLLDSYTADDLTKGNGANNEKVGLLTADEAVMAGLNPGESNLNNYLFTDQAYWLGTPFGFENSTHANMWFVFGTGVYPSQAGYMVSSDVQFERGVRPVIYLSATSDLTGTGEYNDPYVVKTP